MKTKITFLKLLNIIHVIIFVSIFIFVWGKGHSVNAATTTIISVSSSTEVDKILSKNFELLGVSTSTSFGQILNIANSVAERVKIRPAFLLAILQEELSLEKFDMCYVTNIKTGEGVRVVDGQIRKKTLKPDRDLLPFLAITKELGKDPLKTQVTCPMSFGWGGAMGPADFIPSTWVLYKKRIEKITGKPANPWDINDAILAAGLFLSDTGAKSKTYKGEWRAAMTYFSGSPNSKYHFYADGAMKISGKIQQDIDLIKRSSK